MKKNEKTSMSKRRATVAAVLCFVAAIAIAGTYTFNDYRKTQKNELAKAEEKSRQKETKKDNKENSDLTRETGTSKVKSENTGSSTKKSAADESTVDEKNESDGTGMTDQSEQNGTGTQATAGKSHNINFTEDSYILWPVNGAVIMSYSMDKTVYFQTLDQYKYNPARDHRRCRGRPGALRRTRDHQVDRCQCTDGNNGQCRHRKRIRAVIRTAERSTCEGRGLCRSEERAWLCEPADEVLQQRRL